MRAVRLTRFVAPRDIEVTEVGDPPVRAGDVLVRVHAAGVNPSDVKYAAGIVPESLLPRIPGRDFAGVVIAGSAPLDGKEVYGSGGDLGITRDGTHAEMLAVPASAVSLKPRNLTMAEAAAVGVPYVTAFKALIDCAALGPGETLCVIGGSGAVGTAAAQIGKWLGARVLATTRRGESRTDWARSIDRVITLPEEEIAQVCEEFTQGKGAHVVFNVVGAETFEPGVMALAQGGRMVCIAASGERRVSFDLMRFYKRQMCWRGLDTLELTASDCAPLLDAMRPGFEVGAFRVDVAAQLPLEEASKAYERVAQGGQGKVVLLMDPN